jgi:rhodanese-related sulfurtransferase
MKKTLVLLLISVFVFAVAGMAVAGQVPTPNKPPEGVTIVSADKAKEIVGAKEVYFFDMRKALNYGKGHLPGAVSLPYKWIKKGHPGQRTGEFDMSKLPADKNAIMVFHSDGPNGWKSYYASKAAAEEGYKNVMWLRDGFVTWQDKGYPVEH